MRYKKQTALLRENKAYVIRELKTMNDATGEFEGYLAVFDNTDEGDDVVVKGAYVKTLRESKERQVKNAGRYLFPILWMHDYEQPCGGFTYAAEDDHGLFVRGEVDIDTPLGQMMYSGMKKGYISEMSMGYTAVQKQYKGGIRYLKEVKLHEGSLITQNAAMNPDAVITAVKKGDHVNRKQRKAADFMAAYQMAQEDLQEQWHDANVALVQVIYSIMSDEAETDKPAAVATAVDQFKATAVDLATRSATASFTPCLDWDDDSFADSSGNDVYGVDTDEDDRGYYGYGYRSGMSADTDDREVKKGAAMSKANHQKMGALLKSANQGVAATKKAMSGLITMHTSLDPNAEYVDPGTDSPPDTKTKTWAGAGDATTQEDKEFESALMALADQVAA